MKNISKIKLLKNKLPAEFRYFLSGYEVDLSLAVKEPDFFVSLSNMGRYSQIVTEKIYRRLRRDPFLEQNSAEALIKLLSEWQPRGVLSGIMENIWLEFDIDDIDIDNPSASIFAGRAVDKRYRHENDESQQFVKKIIGGGLLPIEESSADMIIRHIGRLFDQTPFSHLGAMIARSDRAARLLCINFSRAGIIEYLRRIEWPGNIDNLNNDIEKFDGLYDALSLQYEIRNGAAGSKIGVEFYFLDRPDSSIRRRQQTFLDIVVNNESYDPAFRRTIPEFSGYSESHDQAAFQIGDVEFRTLDRRRDIHHYKLTFDGFRTVKWKVYLCEEYDWSVK